MAEKKPITHFTRLHKTKHQIATITKQIKGKKNEANPTRKTEPRKKMKRTQKELNSEEGFE